MSYEKVKSINLKTMEITSADSSIRPLTFKKWTMKAENKEDFIKKCLVYFLDGDFHNVGDNFKFVYTIHLFRKTEQCKALQKIRWNNYDFKNKKELFTKEQVIAANEELKRVLYDYYINLKLTKGKYFIKYDCFIVTKITNYRFRYNSRWNATPQIFNSYEKALYTIDTKLNFSNIDKSEFTIHKAD